MATTTGMLDRDVEYEFPGDRFPVSAGPLLRASGWRGGIWVKYVDSTEGEYVVELSDGNSPAGFLLAQSETYLSNRKGGTGPRSSIGHAGSPANWTNGQYRSTAHANVVTMVSGGTRALFRVFETVALVGAGTRTGGAITYSLNEPLKVSENGLLCNDSDANLIAAGVTTPTVVGIVSGVPSSRNGNRLSLDLKY